jgi:hypothetical protein
VSTPQSCVAQNHFTGVLLSFHIGEVVSALPASNARAFLRDVFRGSSLVAHAVMVETEVASRVQVLLVAPRAAG